MLNCKNRKYKLCDNISPYYLELSVSCKCKAIWKPKSININSNSVIVCDKISTITLEQCILSKLYSELELLGYFSNICKYIYFLHQEGLCHNNISIKNIYIIKKDSYLGENYNIWPGSNKKDIEDLKCIYADISNKKDIKLNILLDIIKLKNININHEKQIYSLLPRTISYDKKRFISKIICNKYDFKKKLDLLILYHIYDEKEIEEIISDFILEYKCVIFQI